MKKAIICIVIALSLVLSVSAFAAFPNLSYYDANAVVENEDGTLSINKTSATAYANFNITSPINKDYFEFTFKPDYPAAVNGGVVDGWIMITISDTPNSSQNYASAAFGEGLVLIFNGLGEGADAVPNVYSVTKEHGNPIADPSKAAGNLYLQNNILDGDAFHENQINTFAFRKNATYGYTIEINGKVLKDDNTGDPVQLAGIAEIWGEKDLYVGVGFYACEFTIVNGAITGSANLEFKADILTINNNLPNAEDITTYNGEIPSASSGTEVSSSEPASLPSETATSSTVSIVEPGNGGCGNNG